ncbi:MAG TPA: phosphate acyltransferase PlsX [Trueperaceae bacterium]|nr:phosphate acyltransferase PlsX [Trueperaceae bacterium]
MTPAGSAVTADPRSTDPAVRGRRIAIDAMGGEQMPRAAVDGGVAAHLAGLPVVLVGDEAQLRKELERAGVDLPVVHASDVIGMNEHATDVRRRRDSSVMVAMRLVKDGRAAACVSMGHSGATMAAAIFELGRIKGVERAAILATLPTATGATALLDVGANADCKPIYLQQFAIMGSAFVRSMWGVEKPKVGLMSIGEEPSKGNELTRAAHALLSATPNLGFVGNVEGRDLFTGAVDVVVTDGFTGNVILKQAEGEAKAIFSWVREALRSSVRAQLGGLLVRPALRALAKRLDPAEYGAQPLLGVQGYAFIGHGSSDAKAVTSAVRTAARAVASGAVERLSAAMAESGALASGDASGAA